MYDSEPRKNMGPDCLQAGDGIPYGKWVSGSFPLNYDTRVKISF